MTGEDKVYSLIKDLCDGRVYPEKMEQDEEYPAIVYTLEGIESFSTLCSTVSGGKATIDIICIAESLQEAKQIANDVQAAVAGECVVLDITNDVDLETGIVDRIVTVSVWND